MLSWCAVRDCRHRWENCVMSTIEQAALLCGRRHLINNAKILYSICIDLLSGLNKWHVYITSTCNNQIIHTCGRRGVDFKMNEEGAARVWALCNQSSPNHSWLYGRTELSVYKILADALCDYIRTESVDWRNWITFNLAWQPSERESD